MIYLKKGCEYVFKAQDIFENWNYKYKKDEVASDGNKYFVNFMEMELKIKEVTK